MRNEKFLYLCEINIKFEKLMKKLMTLAFLAAILVSCNFSKGIKTDLTTGLTYSYNGFALDKAIVMNNNNTVNSKNHPLNSKLIVVLQGIKNYTEVEGKVYPGCSLDVTDEAGNVVLHYDDMFEGAEATKEDASVLSLSVTIGEPMAVGKNYTFKAHVFDKKNTENTIDIDLDFEVTEAN